MMVLYPQSKARACDAAGSCITSDMNLQPSHRQVGRLSVSEKKSTAEKHNRKMQIQASKCQGRNHMLLILQDPCIYL